MPQTERADWQEDAIRAFFGYPALKGLLQWYLWNGTQRVEKGKDHRFHEYLTGPNENEIQVMLFIYIKVLNNVVYLYQGGE